MRQYHQQQQEKEVLPSYVPGDVIKERVEPKPELGPLWEMINKRYRTPKEDPRRTAIREDFYDLMEEKALEKATLKEAFDYCIGELISFDDHDRNIIRTEIEIKEIRVKDAKIGIIQTILNGYLKNESDFAVSTSFNRQLAMRKAKFSHYVSIDNIRQRLITAGLLKKEFKDVPKQVGSGRHLKTVTTKETVYSVTPEAVPLLRKLGMKHLHPEAVTQVETLLLDLGFSIG